MLPTSRNDLGLLYRAGIPAAHLQALDAPALSTRMSAANAITEAALGWPDAEAAAARIAHAVGHAPGVFIDPARGTVKRVALPLHAVLRVRGNAFAEHVEIPMAAIERLLRTALRRVDLGTRDLLYAADHVPYPMPTFRIRGRVVFGSGLIVRALPTVSRPGPSPDWVAREVTWLDCEPECISGAPHAHAA